MAASSQALKEAKKRYYQKNKVKRNEYTKSFYKSYSLKIRKEEKEIIELLDQKENKTDYIVNLIKQDMKKGGQ